MFQVLAESSGNFIALKAMGKIAKLENVTAFNDGKETKIIYHFHYPKVLWRCIETVSVFATSKIAVCSKWQPESRPMIIPRKFLNIPKQ